MANGSACRRVPPCVAEKQTRALPARQAADGRAMAGRPELEAVIRIIREVAAEEILPRFRKLAPADIAHKRNPRDLVTVADLAAERALARELCALAPGSVVVGEEATEADPGLLNVLAGAQPVWLLDPVDGTTNYASGTPCFALIVAWCEAGETRAGYIYDPIAGTMLWAAAGEGAWLVGAADGARPIRVAAPQQLGAMRGSLSPRAADRLQGAILAREPGPVPTIVRYGSAGREYMDLCCGGLDFAQYTRLKPWDHAAGVLIHREAGGFSALRGGRPYRVEPRIVEDTLLLAPDAESWRWLDRLLG